MQAEGPGTIAALLVETVPGTAGVLVPPPGWLAGLRAIADRYGIVLIFDEVMAGFGRTGDWFAFQNPQLNPQGIVPDLVTFAKGVNSGYVPAGGVLIPQAIAAEFDTRVFPGGLTYSGHPLAMASIVASIDAMREEGIIDNAARIGSDVLGPALHALAERHQVIGEVRGLGVFWALELVTDRATREPLPAADMAGIKGAPDGRGPAAVRAGQPHPCRAAVHRDGRGGPARGRDPRRRPAVGSLPRDPSRRSGESGRHAAAGPPGAARRAGTPERRDERERGCALAPRRRAHSRPSPAA